MVIQALRCLIIALFCYDSSGRDKQRRIICLTLVKEAKIKTNKFNFKHGYFIVTTEQERVIALAPLKKHTSEMESRIKKVEEIVI